MQSTETERETRRDSAVPRLLLFCLVTSAAQQKNSPVALAANWSPSAFNHNSFVWVCLQPAAE